jgi:hypothetical protein
MKNSLRLLSAALLFFVSSLASAQAVTWYLVGVTFKSGATASGSFTFDSGSSTFTGWNISVSSEPSIGCNGDGGSSCVFSAATSVTVAGQEYPFYAVPSSNPINANLVWFSSNSTSAPPAFLLLGLGSVVLTGAGGVVPIVTGSEGLNLSAVSGEDSAADLEIEDLITAGTLCSSQTCQPPCHPLNYFEICSPGPIIYHRLCSADSPICYPVCDFPCENPVVGWPIPPFNGGGDPWLGNTSVTIEGATWKESASLAANISVEMSTEALVQPPAGRITREQVADGGAAGKFRAVVVGPFVDITARSDALPVLARLFASKAAPIKLSLPYFAPTVRPGTRLRMVMLEKSSGRWLDVTGQSEDVSKKLITARVATGGRYTIIAETSSRR